MAKASSPLIDASGTRLLSPLRIALRRDWGDQRWSASLSKVQTRTVSAPKLADMVRAENFFRVNRVTRVTVCKKTGTSILHATVQLGSKVRVVELGRAVSGYSTPIAESNVIIRSYAPIFARVS